ncbi:hypothetical protein B9479_001382 [Cryptococcus floricola]|uniref:Zn(2)-C6 fungal-type domain-containing protein n=1 Tax=Cryptococcus floricola TaxID=2591691 RepID=A0A5D3B418_9TREE|nr:hypothetical protein B9479_001382 [Cryptococcus floricola]
MSPEPPLEPYPASMDDHSESHYQHYNDDADYDAEQPPPSSPDGSVATNPKADARPQRSRDGCLTCRSRKVKCDEQRPVCDKCRIKARDCVWPSEDEAERRRNKKRKAGGNGFTPRSFNGRSYYGRSVRGKEYLPHSPSPLHIPTISVPVDMPRPPKHAIKGTVHVPPGFLPAGSMGQNSNRAEESRKPPAVETPERVVSKDKGKQTERDDFVDWLVPEKARAELMMEPTFLQPYFPSVDERLIIRHYLSKTVHIIIAFESHRHPWNPWLSIHAPLAFKHLPGINPAADALRIAMLAVGSVHLHYTTHPNSQAIANKICKSAKDKVLSMVKQTLQDQDGRPKQLSHDDMELVLGALLSCTIASSLAADDSWHHLLSSVLILIDQLGGPENILRDAPRDRISPCRFFMEQLAIRDVFGCMTTELAPSILQDAFSPWFFTAQTWSRTDLEWESVERMFGISRGMVDLIARSCGLIAAVRALGKPLFSDNDPSPPASPTRSSQPLPPNSLSELQRAARGLMAEIQVWDEAGNFTPLHPRTQYGNLAYRHAIKIRLLRKVYGVASDDELVMNSVESIIELAAEMLAFYGKITWLTWPIVIAGFEIPRGHPSRRAALEMLGAFGPHACFDNRAGARMLSDFWAWHDMGDSDHAWEVANILNQRPFLD